MRRSARKQPICLSARFLATLPSPRAAIGCTRCKTQRAWGENGAKTSGIRGSCALCSSLILAWKENIFTAIKSKSVAKAKGNRTSGLEGEQTGRKRKTNEFGRIHEHRFPLPMSVGPRTPTQGWLMNGSATQNHMLLNVDRSVAEIQHNIHRVSDLVESTGASLNQVLVCLHLKHHMCGTVPTVRLCCAAPHLNVPSLPIAGAPSEGG